MAVLPGAGLEEVGVSVTVRLGVAVGLGLLGEPCVGVPVGVTKPLIGNVGETCMFRLQPESKPNMAATRKWAEYRIFLMEPSNRETISMDPSRKPHPFLILASFSNLPFHPRRGAASGWIQPCFPLRPEGHFNCWALPR